MDLEALKNAGIDCENGIRRFAGNEALYGKYLRQFLQDGHLQDGFAAMERKDPAGMFEAVHAFKSIVGTLGMTELFTRCSAVVEALRAGKTDNLPELMRQTKEEYERIYTVVKREM